MNPHTPVGRNRFTVATLPTVAQPG
jgi:hypothetical protein